MSQKKSSDTKEIEGNPGHRSIEEQKKLKAEDKILKCPSWINRESKKKFKDLANKLYKYGLTLDIDIDALTAYCFYFVRWRKIESLLDIQLEKDLKNITQLGQRGETENPLIRIASRYLAQWKYFSTKLGLSMLDRYRVGIEPEIKDLEEKTEFEKTLSGL